MLNKILAGAVVILVIAGLWLRSEVVVARSDLRVAEDKAATLETALKGYKQAEEATRKVTVARVAKAKARQEEYHVAEQADSQALAASVDWADQPIPAGVLERLRK